MGQSGLIQTSRGTTAYLDKVSETLLGQSLSTSSQKTYNRAFQVFKDFVKTDESLPETFPISHQTYLRFIAYCYIHRLASSTVATNISALGYCHKLMDLPDSSQSFLVKKCMVGYTNTLKRPDTRLPITPAMLTTLVDSVKHTCQGVYEQLLVKTMFLMAFYAFLRVGEFTANQNQLPILLFSNIGFKHFKQGRPSSVDITLANYKHSRGKSVTLEINERTSSLSCFPVLNLWQYCLLCGSSEGPLFVFLDNTPVSRSFFSQKLSQCLLFCKYDTAYYKGHCFRIGAAKTAAELGHTEAKIQEMGRWQSSAFKKYIRIPSLRL